MMIPLLALSAAFAAGTGPIDARTPGLEAGNSLEVVAPAAATNVRGLLVRPATGRTEVVVQLDGLVAVTDYQLADPARLVVDVQGARHALPGERFNGIERGGVRSVRTSQFSRDVVRVVIDLERRVDYTVVSGAGEIVVSFPNGSGTFEPWQVNAAPTPVQPAADRAPAAPSGASDSGAGARSASGTFAPRPEVRTPPSGEVRQQPRITVTFEGTPIRDVINIFAEFSGRSIVAGTGVAGDVTASITDQPWDVALQAILGAHGFAADEMESGIIRVEPMERLREREKLEDLLTRQFRIRYASVDSVLPAVSGLLTEDGKITRSPSTNTLIVTDRRSVVNRLVPIIDELDVRTPQVTVSAKIIFVDRSALQELGVVYDIKDSRGNQLNSVFPGLFDEDGDGVLEPEERTDNDVILLGGSSIAALANANDRVQQPMLQLLSSLVLGRHTLITFLEALQTLSLVDIQAVPTIKTMDHREARVQVGERTPVRVLDAQSAGGDQGPRATVNFQETGIILRVTPHVTGSQILLDLHAERSGVIPAPSDVGVAFQTQQAQTQVLVEDGETAVISGLTLTEKRTFRSGIPLLMDLPVVGALFRTTREAENKRDLLIMVTPHIDKTDL